MEMMKSHLKKRRQGSDEALTIWGVFTAISCAVAGGTALACHSKYQRQKTWNINSLDCNKYFHRIKEKLGDYIKLYFTFSTSCILMALMLSHVPCWTYSNFMLEGVIGSMIWLNKLKGCRLRRGLEFSIFQISKAVRDICRVLHQLLYSIFRRIKLQHCLPGLSMKNVTPKLGGRH